MTSHSEQTDKILEMRLLYNDSATRTEQNTSTAGNTECVGIV